MTTKTNWFDVDKAGLAAILERRGKSFAIFELVQNAWDSGATAVSINLDPIVGQPYANLTVEDNSPEGWVDADHAFTMFSRSSRGANPEKRGRFNLGEKLVLACCRSATIATMAGTLHFNESGRRRSSDKTSVGTRFTAQIRMTRDELSECEASIAELIPPISTTYNGVPLTRPTLLRTIEAKLPTQIQDTEGNLRPSLRNTKVEVYDGNGCGGVLEMGIPVQTAEWPWRLNVLQKVPLGLDRDSITDSFRRALQVAVVNAMAATLEPEIVSAPWVQESIGDARATGETVTTVIRKQFGERAVVAVVGDPIANARAEADGCTVVHGGSLGADVWANVRKHAAIIPSSRAYPTMKPEERAAVVQAMGGTCPMCNQKLPIVG